MTSNLERRIKILEYVMDRQKANKKTTKADVIRHMREKKLSAIDTTHYLINDLIKEGKLNKEVINSQVHYLTINKNFNFVKMRNEVLGKQIEELVKFFPTMDFSEIIIRKKGNGYNVEIHS
jgi:hypothetical protein